MSQAELESDILQEWQTNALPWTSAVRDHAIESRRVATDQAIVEAVLSRHPRNVLDIGCGEGWLVHTLVAEHGLEASGIDATPALIDAALTRRGEFAVMRYDELEQNANVFAPDLVVANFSLLGDTSVMSALRGSRAALGSTGSLVIQTLHPFGEIEAGRYHDGWREGSWSGCGLGFGTPPPWYFRTLGRWMRDLAIAGFEVEEIREPTHPATLRPASIIFICVPRRASNVQAPG